MGRGPLPITSSRMGHLWGALSHAYEVVGFERAAGGDEVFRQLVLARIIEPTSKLDSLRVLDEVGIDPCDLPHPDPAAAHVREGCVAAEDRYGLRGPGPAGTGVA